MITKAWLKAFVAAMSAGSYLSLVAAGETIYFLVALPKVNDSVVQRDSYVLPLSKQEDIDYARYLISLGSSVFIGSHAALVGAKVEAGQDGINRNYFDPRFPEWSWHVIESAFADVMPEIYDGRPTRLENAFADWPRDDCTGWTRCRTCSRSAVP